MIGIVTKIHNPQANVKLATSWLQLAGCKKIFYVDSKQQEGIPEILEYLREEGDVMPLGRGSWKAKGRTWMSLRILLKNHPGKAQKKAKKTNLENVENIKTT